MKSLRNLSPTSNLICKNLIDNLSLRFVPILSLDINKLSSFLDPRIKGASGLSPSMAVELAEKLFSEVIDHTMLATSSTCQQQQSSDVSAFLAINTPVESFDSPLATEIATYMAMAPVPLLSSPADKRTITELWADCEQTYVFYRKHKTALPILFELARAAFATPISASEIERGFSVSSKMGAPGRNFKPKSLKRMVLLNNNYRFSKMI